MQNSSGICESGDEKKGEPPAPRPAAAGIARGAKLGYADATTVAGKDLVMVEWALRSAEWRGDQSNMQMAGFLAWLIGLAISAFGWLVIAFGAVLEIRIASDREIPFFPYGAVIVLPFAAVGGAMAWAGERCRRRAARMLQLADNAGAA